MKARILFLATAFFCLEKPASAFTDEEHREVAAQVVAALCKDRQKLRKPSTIETLLCEDHLLDRMRSLDPRDTTTSLTFAAVSALVSNVDDDPHQLLTRHYLSSLKLATYASEKHYYPSSRQEYFRWHADAIQMAIVAGLLGGSEGEAIPASVKQRPSADGDLAPAQTAGQQALVFEAFALHFLTDLFAADHASAPLSSAHLSVAARNRAVIGAAGLKGADGLWYYGDGHLEESKKEIELAVAAGKESLREVLDAGAGEKLSDGEIAVPFFGLDTAEQKNLTDGRRSEYVALVESTRVGGSGIRHAEFGPQLRFWICRFFTAAIGSYFFRRQTEYQDFGSKIHLSSTWPRLVATVDARVPLLSAPSILVGINIDLVVDSSFVCNTSGGFACLARPEFSLGPDIFLHLSPRDRFSILEGLRIGPGHVADASYGFQVSLSFGVAY